VTAVAVLGFVVSYTLSATERVSKVKAALGGAAVVVILGIVGSEDVFYSHGTGIDWDVIFLLLGMMVIVGVLRQTGVFEYAAIWATKRAGGSGLRVMILLVLITAVASAFLDNVTTVLLIAPVTLLVCERLDIKPVPFLIAEVFASNIGGAATLVGDPPNIIIASRAGLSFNDFLLHMAPLVIIALVGVTTPHALGIDDDRFPVRAVATLQRSPFQRGNVYNPDQFGGFLIWSFYPQRRTLTDGRNELYHRYNEEYARARLDSREWHALLRKYRVDLAVDEYRPPLDTIDAMTRQHRAMPASLAYFPRRDWALIAYDRAAMVFVRRAAFPAADVARFELRGVVPDR
jgi:hypothetical protein